REARDPDGAPAHGVLPRHRDGEREEALLRPDRARLGAHDHGAHDHVVRAARAGDGRAGACNADRPEARRPGRLNRPEPTRPFGPGPVPGTETRPAGTGADGIRMEPRCARPLVSSRSRTAVAEA